MAKEEQSTPIEEPAKSTQDEAVAPQNVAPADLKVPETVPAQPIEETPAPSLTIVTTRRSRFAARFFGTKKRKIVSIIAIIVILIALTVIIPFTRYAALGWLVKKDVPVSVKDSQTGKPVSGVTVALGTVSASTDKDGNAVLKSVPIGQYSLQVTKKYYKTSLADYTVGLFMKPAQATEKLTAIGRQVTFKTNDRISGKALADVKLSVNGTTAISDSNGEATIVLAPNEAKQQGTLSRSGYNDGSVTVAIDDDEATNTFTITPTGSVVYLSNATGKINVMRANLDGTNATTLIAGTGTEDRYATSLLSSRDWKYSVLSSKRTSDKVSLNLVSTADGTISNIDEGDAYFNSVGWSGHKFIYTVTRNVASWSDKAQALKVYDADTGTLSTIDQTTGTGTNYYDAEYQYFSQVYIIDSQIVYAKTWSIAESYFYGQDPGKSSTLYSVDSSSLKRSVVKDFPQHQTYSNLTLNLYEPQGIYVLYSDSGNNAYYEYEDGSLQTIDKPNISNQYPTYLVSPSGNKTFWYELRDGKNTIFIGDKEGKNAKQIATLSDYVPYGWYGDNDQYILFTKNNSELYIAPASDISGNPSKLTDYYKVQTYPGYGYGYGGQ